MGSVRRSRQQTRQGMHPAVRRAAGMLACLRCFSDGKTAAPTLCPEFTRRVRVPGACPPWRVSISVH
jgi:hypothetical protein